MEVLEGDGDPSNGDAADFTINGTVTDVRDASATGPDYNPVASPGAADMTLVWNVRISDDLNTTPSDPCSPSCPATVIDFDFPAVGNVSCAATGDFTIGSTCTISATGDSFIPDLVKEGRKMVFQFDRARLIDAGSDGIPGNANDEDAFTQGFYVP